MPLPSEADRLAWPCAICGRPGKDHVAPNELGGELRVLGHIPPVTDHRFKPRARG